MLISVEPVGEATVGVAVVRRPRAGRADYPTVRRLENPNVLSLETLQRLQDRHNVAFYSATLTKVIERTGNLRSY